MKKMCGFLWFKLVSLPTSLTIILVIFYRKYRVSGAGTLFYFYGPKIES